MQMVSTKEAVTMAMVGHQTIYIITDMENIKTIIHKQHCLIKTNNIGPLRHL